MRHAGPVTLARLTPLIEALRRIPGLNERRPGIFYKSGRAFLHFHEDPAGCFVDVRCGAMWERLAADTDADYRAILRLLKESDPKFDS